MNRVELSGQIVSEPEFVATRRGFLLFDVRNTYEINPGFLNSVSIPCRLFGDLGHEWRGRLRVGDFVRLGGALCGDPGRSPFVDAKTLAKLPTENSRTAGRRFA
jgi:hypothetical protein